MSAATYYPRLFSFTNLAANIFFGPVSRSQPVPLLVRIWCAPSSGISLNPPEAAAPSVAANSDWTDRETLIYAALCKDIVEKLPKPQPWPALPDLAFGIAADAANKLSDGQKGALDFSIPEALLLADRILVRLRGKIRDTLPPVVVAVSATDRLLQGWPYPEHILPDPEKQTVTALVAAVARDLDARNVIPFSAEDPVWNIDTLVETIGDHATEALMTQRNRRRLDGEIQQSGWSVEADRVREGMSQTAGLIWSRIVKTKD